MNQSEVETRTINIQNNGNSGTKKKAKKRNKSSKLLNGVQNPVGNETSALEIIQSGKVEENGVHKEKIENSINRNQNEINNSSEISCANEIKSNNHETNNCHSIVNHESIESTVHAAVNVDLASQIMSKISIDSSSENSNETEISEILAGTLPEVAYFNKEVTPSTSAVSEPPHAIAIANLPVAVEEDQKTKIQYKVYESELEMPDIMRLIQKDLSEPYSVYTYRYFIHNWPKLCFLAMHESKCVGAIVCKLDMHRQTIKRGYIAMLAVDKDYRKLKIGTTLVQKAIRVSAIETNNSPIYTYATIRFAGHVIEQC